MKSLILIVALLFVGCTTIKVEVSHKELRKAGLDSVNVTYDGHAFVIGLK